MPPLFGRLSHVLCAVLATLYCTTSLVSADEATHKATGQQAEAPLSTPRDRLLVPPPELSPDPLALPPDATADAGTHDGVSARIVLGVLGSAMSGYIHTPRGGQPGTTTHKSPSIDELALNGMNQLPTLDLNVRIASHTIHLRYLHVDLGSSFTLNYDLTSQARDFPAGSNITSHFKMPTYALGYRPHALELGSANWQLIPEFGMNLIQFQYGLRSASASGAVLRSYNVMFPYLGLAFTGQIVPNLALDVTVTASDWVSVSAYLNAQAQLRYAFYQEPDATTELIVGFHGGKWHRRDSQPNDVNLLFGGLSNEPWTGLFLGLGIAF